MNETTDLAVVALATKGSQVSAEEQVEWVRRFNQSGLSLRKFSARHGLRCMTLCRWVNQQRALELSPADEPKFVELKMPAAAPEPAVWSAELSFANGNVLRLNGQVPPAMLEQLLRVC